MLPDFTLQAGIDAYAIKNNARGVSFLSIKLCFVVIQKLHLIICNISL